MSNPSNRQFTVIGAGPYGLAVANHLRAAGAQVRTFGKPMEFWDSQMPKGMLLRSPWLGSNIADPEGALSLERYESDRGKIDRHVRLEDFVRYGRWFQQHGVPDLDTRSVSMVDSDGSGYRLRLEDGESFQSQNVVVATGIGYFPNRPEAFASIPDQLASHASHRSNRDLSRFAGKRVAVVGAGQSAIESAALLHEGGAEVEVLIRGPQLRWLKPRWPRVRPLIEWALDTKLNPLRAPARIGSSGIGWLVERPALFAMMSRKKQDEFTKLAIRPAASSWLEPRIQGVTLSPNQSVLKAAVHGEQVELQLHDGGRRTVDHVLLGTGYSIDIARYGFLSPDLLQRVGAAGGYPILNRGFESSSPGLYFVGAPAAHSFGPLLRFVVGTQYAARTLANYAVQTSATRTSLGLRRASAAAR